MSVTASSDALFPCGLQEKGADKKAAAKAAALAKAKGAEKKPEKAAPVERTQCVYEVKPAEAGQDMADLERRVRSVQREGLSWGEQFKVVDVAFGIQKLIVQFLVDDRCGLQEVEDAVRCAPLAPLPPSAALAPMCCVTQWCMRWSRVPPCSTCALLNLGLCVSRRSWSSARTSSPLLTCAP